MDLNAFMKKYAEEINGQYSEYDNNKSIIIVPLPDERYQTVIGNLRKSKRNNRLSIEFTSNVCQFEGDIDCKALLEENANLDHACFIVQDDFIKIESSNFVDSVNENTIKEIIQEVANVADEYEFKLTGEDVH